MSPISPSDRDTLVITPTLRVTRRADGSLATTRKFIGGVLEYAKTWPGPVRVLMQPMARESGNLDDETINESALGFTLRICDFSSPDLVEHLRGAGVCLASVGFEQNDMARRCHQAGVACVYASELSLRTRCQIARTSGAPGPRLWKQYAWECRQELRQRAAVRESDGIQCNGTPTYEAYKPLSADPMLYFDTRVSAGMLANDHQAASRGRGPSLRLVFSGRLVRIKGVDHLPRVAAQLARRGVEFSLTICGDGDQRPTLQGEIDRLGLASRVRLAGVLDFASQLMPFVRDQCDLFVCCHRQGDPSCTYLETMSCGVPIAGYANEALAGLVRASGTGWTSPVDDPEKLGDAIAQIARTPQVIREHAARAIAFASQHTFEQTFGRRVEHLRRIAQADRRHRST